MTIDSNWSYYFTVTVDHTKVNGDCTDYPIYVKLDNLGSGHSFWSNVKSDGSDIRVSKSDGTTEVPLEVVAIDTSAKTGELYFKADGTLSSSTDTVFRVYYGYASASAYSTSATYGRNNVWTSDFEIVAHFQEDPDTTGFVNSTGGTGGTYTNLGGLATATGKIGKCCDFSGSSPIGYVDFATFSTNPHRNFACSMFLKFNNSTATGQTIFEYASPGGLNTRRVAGLYASQKLNWNHNNVNGNIQPTTTISNSTWYHMSVNSSQVDSTHASVAVWIDGATKTSNTNYNSDDITASLGVLGCNRGFASEDFDGFMDEFRFYKATKNDAWMLTESENLRNPSTFYTLSAQIANAPTVLISKATGNFTASGTWCTTSTVANSFLDSEAGTTLLTTSNQDSATITPGIEIWEGIALKVSAIASSPSGTMSVILRNTTLGVDTGTVTVNVSDLPYNASTTSVPSWVFFKFSSPLTLAAATNYVIRCVTSASSQVTLYTNGTTANWARYVRTSTTAAPAAGNNLLVLGEYTGAGTSNSYTVTMDSTSSSTSYGSTTQTDAIFIGGKGTLQYGTTGSTAYKLKMKGRCRVGAGGTLNIGTTGTRMPSTSTAEWIFDVTSNVDSGIVIDNGGTFNGYGNRKNNYYTVLTSNASASATSLVMTSTTDFIAADTIGLAPTTRTSTEFESRAISSVTNSTTLAVSAITNAHNGTSPTQAEVVNLTRNVKIYGTSQTLCGYILSGNYATTTLDSIECYYLGSGTTDKKGIALNSVSPTCLMTYSSIHDSHASGLGIEINAATANGTTVSNNIFYANGVYNLSIPVATSGTPVLSGNVCIGGGSTASINSADAGATISSNIVAGCPAVGFYISEAGAAIGTFSGNTAHSNGSYGFQLLGLKDSTLSSITSWRNNASGIYFSGTNCSYETGTLFGNNTNNLLPSTNCGNIKFKTYNIHADTTFAVTNGIQIATTGGYGTLRFESCDFGTASGIKTTHTNDVNLSANAAIKIELINSKLASTNEFTGQSYLDLKSSVASQNHDQTEESHKVWQQQGIATSDSTLVDTGYSLSQRLTPSSASIKMFSGSKKVAVRDSGTVTISAKVRRSTTGSGDAASHNGNYPRLIVKANPALGSNFNADTVLATATSASNGAWETLSATTSATTAQGAMEFYIDTDGTTGWVNVSTWSVT